MLIRRFTSLTLILSLSVVCTQAQVAPEPQKLESNKPIEREIAGGESHTYPVSLGAGQYVRVVAEQRGIDVRLSLAGSDGNPLIESDLSGIIGAPESLAYEAAAAGTYQLAVRAKGAATRRGVYVARLEVKASASAQDRKRITAESLLNEAFRLYDQRLYADPKLSEKLEQALGLFGELEDRYSQDSGRWRIVRPKT